MFLAPMALLVGCDPDVPEGADGPGAPDRISYNLRECPHTWNFERDAERQGPDASGINALTSGYQDIPEFNDCQAFIVGSEASPAYDSIYAIFATKPALLDAVARPAETPSRNRRAAAIVYAENDYAPLGILTGFNCLAMAVHSDSGWTATMVPVKSLMECSESITTPGTSLHVVADSSFGSDARYYPPVARWGFDRENWQQYIVIRCGSATCFVGTNRLQIPEAPPTPAGLPQGDDRRRVFDVAGWYDEQPLASAGDGTGLVPSNVRGIAIPDPDLGTRNAPADFAAWVPVATVHLSESSREYKTKFNFDTGGANAIDACMLNQGAECPGIPATLDCSAVDQGSGERWRIRITSAGGDVAYRCVERFPITATSITPDEIPGTVRWRWAPDDEKLWFRCMSGCCEGVP